MAVMARNMARRMSRSMARNLAGGAADWRLSVPGIQASFRLGANNEYATLVGSDIEDLTDSILPADKTVSEARYVLLAPSAGQRPAVSAGGAMAFTAANAERLDGAAALVAHCNGTAPWSVSTRVSFDNSASTNESVWGVSNTGDVGNNRYRYEKQDGNTVRVFRMASGSFSNSFDSAYPLTSGTYYTLGAVFTGTLLNLYVDGGLESSVASTASSVGLNLLRLATSESATGYMSGRIGEWIMSVAAHDAAEMLSVHNNLAAEYPNP